LVGKRGRVKEREMNGKIGRVKESERIRERERK
jgi:hypothetical protein